MNLLRDDRKMVQYEGFHVFKVFVANPHKSIAVQKILIANRERLLRFLGDFLQERTEDEQFLDEREFLVRQIRGLPEAPVEPAQKPTLSLGDEEQVQSQSQSQSGSRSPQKSESQYAPSMSSGNAASERSYASSGRTELASERGYQ